MNNNIINLKKLNVKKIQKYLKLNKIVVIKKQKNKIFLIQNKSFLTNIAKNNFAEYHQIKLGSPNHFRVNFDEATSIWGVDGFIDTYYYGGYFDQESFKNDLEIEIYDRYVGFDDPIIYPDPIPHIGFYERYESLKSIYSMVPAVDMFLRYLNNLNE